jgi:hypothetical protein
MIRCSSAVKRGSLALRWVEGLGAEYELRDERPLCAYADSVGSSAANAAAVASAIAAARNTISASKRSLSEPPTRTRRNFDGRRVVSRGSCRLRGNIPHYGVNQILVAC